MKILIIFLILIIIITIIFTLWKYKFKNYKFNKNIIEREINNLLSEDNNLNNYFLFEDNTLDDYFLFENDNLNNYFLFEDNTLDDNLINNFPENNIKSLNVNPIKKSIPKKTILNELDNMNKSIINKYITNNENVMDSLIIKETDEIILHLNKIYTTNKTYPNDEMIIKEWKILIDIYGKTQDEKNNAFKLIKKIDESKASRYIDINNNKLSIKEIHIYHLIYDRINNDPNNKKNKDELNKAIVFEMSLIGKKIPCLNGRLRRFIKSLSGLDYEKNLFNVVSSQEIIDQMIDETRKYLPEINNASPENKKNIIDRIKNDLEKKFDKYLSNNEIKKYLKDIKTTLDEYN